LCQLSDNEVGWCGARRSEGGTIKPRTYGKISSLAVDPIEKKPLYHFYPGEWILSLGSHGCNMGCLHCQNSSISMERSISGLREMPPEEVVNKALSKNIKLIASTYNEPMIAFEYVKDIAILAHKNNLKMAVVDNGYITKGLATALAPYIDAANIDIKGFSSEFYKNICGVPSWKPILRTCEIFHKEGVHLELTNLVIPTKNDSDKMIRDLCKWIIEKLDPAVPLHFSRFHPDHKLRNIPATPISTLEKAYNLAKDIGLQYVYVGNIRNHEGNNTFCHSCGKLVIQRSGYSVWKDNLKGDHCVSCGTHLPIINPET
jgi:pyruvate formate lyase activating enzyme